MFIIMFNSWCIRGRQNAFLAVSSLQGTPVKDLGSDCIRSWSLLIYLLFISTCRFASLSLEVLFFIISRLFTLTLNVFLCSRFFVGNSFTDCVRFSLIFNMENNRSTFVRWLEGEIYFWFTMTGFAVILLTFISKRNINKASLKRHIINTMMY